jgi:hypothetical protein
MTDRRYNEEEVAAIFERAAEAQQSARRHLGAGEGMTLADLEEIGRDVGIPTDLVAQAAKSLDQGGRPGARSYLGLPVSVGRTVELDRRLTEEEWEHLVVDLRETFDARGQVSSHGSLRQWTNGNLQALLEPTPSGHRLRLKTVRGNSIALMSAGLAFGGISAVILLFGAVSGEWGGALGGAFGIAAAGLATFALGAFRVPTWARTRRRQMEGVAARLAIAAEGGRDGGGGSEDSGSSGSSGASLGIEP